MSKKSAASFKPVAQKPELPPIEETWMNAKQAFINTIEVSEKLAQRVDNGLNIRDYAYRFWNAKKEPPEIDLIYIKELCDLSVFTYHQIKERIESFEMEEFLKEEMKDYFEDLIPKLDEIDNEEKLCEAGLIFLTVKPWGEKMTALHHTMLDEAAQRK